ncbi:MAG: GxxExxY protein [bacterium]|nr:GxxExxY protein [bacterium]
METNDSKILYKDLSYKLNGLFFAIHKELGWQRSEKSYADALEQKLKDNNISYEREMPLLPSFTGEGERRNVPDFVINGIIIIDLKAKRFISTDDYYQMRRYLSASDLRLGIIVNFRQYRIYPKRVLLPSDRS